MSEFHIKTFFMGSIAISPEEATRLTRWRPFRVMQMEEVREELRAPKPPKKRKRAKVTK